MPSLTDRQLVQGPSVEDFLGQQRTNTINTNRLSLAGKNAGLRTSLNLGSFATPGQGGLSLGLANIANLIGTQGRIDPLALNLRLADIATGTQQQVDATRGDLAAAGLQGSGVGQALLSAQRGAGQAARTQEIANEQTRARARQTQELQGLLFPIIQAIIEQQALAQGGDQFRATQQAQQRGAQLGFLGTLGGGLLGVPGLFGSSNTTNVLD